MTGGDLVSGPQGCLASAGCSCLGMSQSVGGWDGEFRVGGKVRMLMLRELTRKGRDLAGKRYISGKWNSVWVMQTLPPHTPPTPTPLPGKSPVKEWPLRNLWSKLSLGG